MTSRRALITGIAGQDGSYLAELLVARGYAVHGIHRVGQDLARLRSVRDRLHLHAASVDDHAAVAALVSVIRPDECYHLAARSFVSYAFDAIGQATVNANIAATYAILAALRAHARGCRFYFAGSSEMFGNAEETPQREGTRFHPRSPYGIAKVAGYDLTRNHRQAYGLHAACGILYNHESERRGAAFVTRKVSLAAAAAKLGRAREVRLGNLDARRDWGYAPEYIEAMWRMVQLPEPGDYVVATGRTFVVRDFVAAAFDCVGLDWRDYCVVDETLYRPGEANELRGDASRARRDLGWSPQVGFHELVRRMVEADLARLRREEDRAHLAV
jgi:GDPmannose 4,6-dehydratase